jgi:hypothetical protein
VRHIVFALFLIIIFIFIIIILLRHMVQHVLLPVNIHFHWNLFIFEFLTIYFDFILAAILKWWPFWKF